MGAKSITIVRAGVELFSSHYFNATNE
jgi:hypothetical protein